MNIKEASKKWNVSETTVKNYCQEGMVLFAEKIGRKWNIPDKAEKPLFTRHRAVQFMSYIAVYREGGNPNLQRAGFSPSDIINAYTYLSDAGFTTPLGTGKTLEDKLKNVQITVMGKGLIEGELTAREKPGKTKLDGYIKLSLLKIIEAQVGLEKEF